MRKEIAYHNGHFVAGDQLTVHTRDVGFMLGVTVAEQLRTFGGALFEVEAHFARLKTSLEIVGLNQIDTNQLVEATKHVAQHNYALLESGQDLGVTVFVTPGLYPTDRPDGESQPNLGIHTYPLPFSLWAEKYALGQHCEIVSIPQIDQACWPRELKCRSRMHYYLADREARTKNPQARAILLDRQGYVNEASTANVLAYFENTGLVSPPLQSILPGVSLRYVERLANKLGSNFTYRSLTVEELMSADEVLLSSTPFCLLPVAKLGERVLTQRHCYHWLMKAWSSEVGLDIELQAKAMAGQ